MVLNKQKLKEKNKKFKIIKYYYGHRKKVLSYLAGFLEAKACLDMNSAP